VTQVVILVAIFGRLAVGRYGRIIALLQPPAIVIAKLFELLSDR
jgi:hypothetical protein